MESVFAMREDMEHRPQAHLLLQGMEVLLQDHAQVPIQLQLQLLQCATELETRQEQGQELGQERELGQELGQEMEEEEQVQISDVWHLQHPVASVCFLFLQTQNENVCQFQKTSPTMMFSTPTRCVWARQSKLKAQACVRQRPIVRQDPTVFLAPLQ